MSRYQEFLKSFEKSVLQSKRNIEEIELIAVSKRQPIENILSIINEGHLCFGENQIQEVLKKWPEIRGNHPKVKTHFIGTIQSKKLVDIAKSCDVVHTIDREKLLQILSKMDQKLLVEKSFFIQINTGNEAQKSGIKLDYAEEFLELCKNHDIKADGLMCIPPENESPAKHFEIMQSLARNNHIKSLSMGMSNDFDIALQYGSTHIRVGTAIFGKRD
jgi:pyridoxal phosphate enzyme (YggS family)